jgi:Protein of unknown function (DUF3047)
MVAPRPLTAVPALGLLLLSSVAPGLAAAECVTLDDFSAGRIGEFPAEWRPRNEAGRPVYSIREERGSRYLRAAARRLGVQAGREVGWDLGTHPVLSWRWRPIELPKGSDERKPGSNDSALAVYVVFPGSTVSVRSIKYIWSRRVPVGTHLTSRAGSTQVRVLRSGAAPAGHWLEERVNVREDYRRYFGGAEVPRPAGIAVLTDSDDTGSSAQGDYGGFRACRP